MSSDNNDEVIQKIKELPAAERVKAVALYHHLLKKKALDEDLEKKMQALQREYDLKNLPIYTKQNEIITGVRAPTQDELKDSDKFLNQTEKEQLQIDSKPIQNYWFKALKTNEAMQDVTAENEKDWVVLESLEKVELIIEEKANYTLVFTFRQNEFFTNTELRKTFIFESEDDEEPIKSISTPIDWKDGQNITVKKVTKKQKNKKTGASRNVTKDVEAPSFFNFFKDFDLTHEENADEEEQEKHEEKMNNDFDLGQEFFETIIPFSLELYMGLQPEVHEVDDEDFDDEGDDDDDDEDDDDKKKKNRKKSGDSTKESKDAKAAKPECKQQ